MIKPVTWAIGSRKTIIARLYSPLLILQNRKIQDKFL